MNRCGECEHKTVDGCLLLVECECLVDALRWRWLRSQGGWPESEAATSGMSPEWFDHMADEGMGLEGMDRDAALPTYDELIGALAGMASQYLRQTGSPDSVLWHSFMGAGESCLDILERVGVVKSDNGVNYRFVRKG